MQSLAVLAAIVVLSVMATGVTALALTIFGYRHTGALVGAVAVTAGLWLFRVLPHAWFIYVPVIGAGSWAICRLMQEKNGLP